MFPKRQICRRVAKPAPIQQIPAPIRPNPPPIHQNPAPNPSKFRARFGLGGISRPCTTWFDTTRFTLLQQRSPAHVRRLRCRRRRSPETLTLSPLAEVWQINSRRYSLADRVVGIVGACSPDSVLVLTRCDVLGSRIPPCMPNSKSSTFE